MIFFLVLALIGSVETHAAGALEPPPLIRSAQSGRWSLPTSWEGGVVPRPGARVQVRTGHVLIYDVRTERPIRSIHIAGVLRFDPERDTQLDVGLIKIQEGEDANESVPSCEAHVPERVHRGPRPALEVGSPNSPIRSDRTALIRLWDVEGLDPKECPAIVCCGGKMDLHGSPMSRTWVKLGGRTASEGQTELTLAEPISGWRVGDKIIITSTKRHNIPDEGAAPSVLEHGQTEERTIKRLMGGGVIELDQPLSFAHRVGPEFAAEVANLSRNVIIESAEPSRVRGHTMYHRNSTGSISHAEFRHLGKPGQLGKYALHFHRAGDSMRGSSVIGASIWDSGNRWITIHGTDYLVVRDCVGFRSKGHGFFLEDGTETNNLLDRNLAVQALGTAPLPGQVMGFDHNDGAGFWWGNSGNAFTRNVAVECDEYGFRFDAQATPDFDPVLSLRGSKGPPRDIRSVPFLKFDGNEAHTQRRYGVNLGGKSGIGDGGGGVDGVGPDSRHPSKVRDLRVWDTHWALTPSSPGSLFQDITISGCDFGLWHPRYDRQAYRDMRFLQTRWASYAEHGTRPEPTIFPAPLEPVDDRPPVTVILGVKHVGPGQLLVHGVAFDDQDIKSVRVNGREATARTPGFRDWEITLESIRIGLFEVSAQSEDMASNLEPTPHQQVFDIP